MVLGLLPEIRGGLGELARTGQHSRFIEGYLKPYMRAFSEVRYFSYRSESLHDYSLDPELLARVQLFPGARVHPWLYTFLMPFRYRRPLRGCAVLRVFQVTGAIPAVLAQRLFGVPFVTTYGYQYSKFDARSRGSRRLRQAVEAIGLSKANAVIVTTPELESYVTGKVPRTKVHLIPNGVDTDRFSPVDRVPSSIKKILFVGRLADQKNLGTLIEAAGKLTGRLNVRLVFIGDGPLRARLEARARELGVPLEIRPIVDHRALPDCYREADAFVLPSLIEGHPKVLLEAMSCGLPCLASDVSGNRAVIVDGETGLLFEAKNAGALAERLGCLLTELGLAGDLGARARKSIVESYDLSALVSREIELLRRVAARL